jgi:hypothetical protein
MVHVRRAISEQYRVLPNVLYVTGHSPLAVASTGAAMLQYLGVIASYLVPHAHIIFSYLDHGGVSRY